MQHTCTSILGLSAAGVPSSWIGDISPSLHISGAGHAGRADPTSALRVRQRHPHSTIMATQSLLNQSTRVRVAMAAGVVVAEHVPGDRIEGLTHLVSQVGILRTQQLDLPLQRGNGRLMGILLQHTPAPSSDTEPAG